MGAQTRVECVGKDRVCQEEQVFPRNTTGAQGCAGGSCRGSKSVISVYMAGRMQCGVQHVHSGGKPGRWQKGQGVHAGIREGGHRKDATDSVGFMV